MTEDIAKRESTIINLLRFPMIVLVVFIHAISIERLPVFDSDFSLISPYRLITEAISHNFAEIAVPFFFLVSGYYFFTGVKNLSIQVYATKLKKRVKTLVLPYLLWNSIYIILIFLRYFITKSADEQYTLVTTSSIFKLITIDPIVYPLWFMRDLIVMVIISPLFYFLNKYSGKFGYVLLVLFFFSCLEIPFPGLSSRAISFFGIGSFLALDKKTIIEVCRKFRYAVIPLLVIFLGLSICFNETSFHEYFVRLYIPCGIITAINIVDGLYNAEKTYHFWLRLSGMTFFIYATHTIYIVNIVKGFLRSVNYNYFLIPLITLPICLVAFILLEKLTPRLLSIITGQRHSLCTTLHLYQ